MPEQKQPFLSDEAINEYASDCAGSYDHPRTVASYMGRRVTDIYEALLDRIESLIDDKRSGVGDDMAFSAYETALEIIREERRGK